MWHTVVDSLERRELIERVARWSPSAPTEPVALDSFVQNHVVRQPSPRWFNISTDFNIETMLMRVRVDFVVPDHLHPDIHQCVRTMQQRMNSMDFIEAVVRLARGVPPGSNSDIEYGDALDPGYTGRYYDTREPPHVPYPPAPPVTNSPSPSLPQYQNPLRKGRNLSLD